MIREIKLNGTTHRVIERRWGVRERHYLLSGEVFAISRGKLSTANLATALKEFLK